MKAKRIGIVILILAALGAGYMLRGGCAPEQPALEAAEALSAPAPTAEEKPQIWTCAMHPQIVQQKSGKCPICAMELIPR